MSRTPVFLWSLCELYAHKLVRDSNYEITTKTELFALQLTIFLHKHLKYQNKTFMNIFDIYKSHEVQQFVFFLAELAAEMYKEGTTFFSLTDRFKNRITMESLEMSRIVSQVQLGPGRTGSVIYFHHSALQEFLAVLYWVRQLLLKRSPSTFGTDFMVKFEAVPIYCGLLNAYSSHPTDSKILKLFLRHFNLSTEGNSADDCILSILERGDFRPNGDLFLE